MTWLMLAVGFFLLLSGILSAPSASGPPLRHWGGGQARR